MTLSFDITAAQALADRYTAWLDARHQGSAEIMHGLFAGQWEAVRLDGEGLASRGWDRLPPDEPRAPAGRFLVGGYDEDRAIYDGPVFAAAPGEDRRSVHLAIDIFAPEGTPVFAPLAGRLHSFQDNAATLDYGPTIILEHAVMPELTFYTLYGHLSRDSLDGRQVGDVVTAGDQLGSLGDAGVNGGWSPHLHVQVILDMMGRQGDFPGVFQRRHREAWKLICPDPAPLLGIK